MFLLVRIQVGQFGTFGPFGVLLVTIYVGKCVYARPPGAMEAGVRAPLSTARQIQLSCHRRGLISGVRSHRRGLISGRSSSPAMSRMDALSLVGWHRIGDGSFVG